MSSVCILTSQHVNSYNSFKMATNNKPILESKAITPRDPAIKDENDWPEYHLRNVEVTSKNGRIVSLLHAGPNYPVTVTGTLEALERSKAKLRK
jgi:hypothetical protein